MLKRITIGLVLAGSVLFAKVSSEYGIYAVGMSMDYKEYKDGVLLNNESSNYTDLTGAEFKYKYIMQTQGKQDYDAISLHVMALSGDTTYKGSYIGSGLGYGSVISTTSNKVYDVALDFAHRYQQTSHYNITVSLGLGYRFWRRELSAQQVEDYKWFSLRPSVAFAYEYKNFSIAPKFEYQYGLRPRMSATGINDEFKLGSANIMDFTLPIEYALNQNFSLYGAYTYQYQKIQESNVVYDNSGAGYFEPQSKAYNDYIKFGVIFKY